MLFSLIFYHDLAVERFGGKRVAMRMDSGPDFRAGSVVAILNTGRTRGFATGYAETGALPMNFAAKLNVVAAYAAFALVCLIVFGMI